jgi:acetyl esterase/lipase
MRNILFWKNETTDQSAEELKAANIPHLIPFVQKEAGAPYSCVIVLPGGGYEALSPQEADPVAGWLNGLGISAFVLHYSVAPARHPQPYHDVRRAIQWVRAHAEHFNIDPNRIGVLGFSAGGHLTGSAATMWEDASLAIGDELDSISARPDLAVMCYPVVTGDSVSCHEGSLLNLMGGNLTDEVRDSFSLEKRVSSNTPPIFLWHTVDDATVPVNNAFLMAQALGKAGVEYELHVFPEGRHGLGLCSIGDRRNAYLARWRGLCAQWLVRQGF